MWWESAIDRVHATTSCAWLSLIHLSISRLSGIHLNVQDKCSRCHNSCNLSHMFFLFQELHIYWDGFFFFKLCPQYSASTCNHVHRPTEPLLVRFLSSLFLSRLHFSHSQPRQEVRWRCAVWACVYVCVCVCVGQGVVGVGGWFITCGS